MSKIWIFFIITYSVLFPLIWIYKQYSLPKERIMAKVINKTLHTDNFTSMCMPSEANIENCWNSISGGKKIKTQKWINTNDSLCNMEKLLNKCDKFRKVHRYFSKPLSDEEKEFPLAFSIKMHKNPEQAEQLLRTIYMPQNFYCIYVDGKSNDNVFQTMNRIGKCFKNIHVIQSRDGITYSSVDMLKADLVCMKYHLKRNKHWKYHINLAGQEFPLKTNLETVRILKILNGVNDIESYDYPKGHDLRYRFVWERGNNIMEVTTKKKSPFHYKIEMSKGSGYPILSYDFVKFILQDEIAVQFLNWLYDTYAPEETFFATLNTLPWAPGGYKMEVRHILGTYLSRAVIWTGDPAICHGKMVRYVCVYGKGDLPWLSSRPQIIANKFDREFDQTVLDCLERDIRHRTKYPQIDKLDWNYYGNLPHVKYYSKLTENQKSAEYLQMMKKQWLTKQSVGNNVRNILKRHKYSNVTLI